MIEPVLAFLRGELLHQRQPPGIRNVGVSLPAQCSMTDGFKPRLEGIEHLFLVEVGELFAETLQVAEGMFIYEADQAEQLQQRVL